MSQTAWILSQRPQVDRPEPAAELLHWQDEWEPALPSGGPISVRTLFLRGSECRFHCTMCDLWQYTHTSATPVGNISAQVGRGTAVPPADVTAPVRWLKLYNAANFFDSHNVPVEDLPSVAAACQPFERLIVENHPRVLPWKSIESFRDAVRPARLEVALGLETIHRESLELLNKQATLEQFQSAIRQFKDRDIDVRTFVLLGLPDMSETEALLWCQHSIDWAAQQCVRHVSVIPLRGRMGAMQHFLNAGRLIEPKAHWLEKVLADNLGRNDCVVTVDLWDWPQLRGQCLKCVQARRERLDWMNLHRTNLPPIPCEHCDAIK